MFWIPAFAGMTIISGADKYHELCGVRIPRLFT